MTDDDRVFYLIGEQPAGPLDLGERAALAELRDLLADPAIWAEPSPVFEDRIVVAIFGTALAGSPATGPVGGPLAEPTRSGIDGTGVTPLRRRRWRWAR